MAAQHTDLDRLHALLDGDDALSLRALILGLAPGDVARLVTRLDRDEQRKLLTLLPLEDAAQVLRELTPQQAAPLLMTLTADRAAALVELCPSNDQADLLVELGADAGPILAALSNETAARVQQLSQHSPDTAGGLMVAEYLSYAADATVGDVIEDLRSHAAAYSRMHAQYAYITGSDRRLIGVLRLRDLLLLERHESVRRAMTPEPERVRANTSLDQLLRFFDRHPFFAVPVVDAADQLLGVVLRVDVEEATAERADRRMLLMSGVLEGEESRTMSWTFRVARRAPWLLVSLLLSLAAASVIGWYQETVASAIALAVFLPVVSGMGGNSGNQALAVSIRELSLGLIQPQEFRWVILKEASVGLANGLLLGASVAALCLVWQRDVRLSAVVGAAIAMNTLFAACLGGIVPLVLKRCRLDPALASGPVLSAITDLCGFLIALVLADLLLPGPAP
jgi:magnesium transporter